MSFNITVITPQGVDDRLRYDPARHLYNGDAATLRGFRDLVARASSGGLGRLTIIGDSKTAGLFDTGAVGVIDGSKSWPGQLRAMLGSRGIPVAGTGTVFAYLGSTAGQGDNRFTFTADWTNTGFNTHFLQSSTVGGTLTFTSDMPGTIVEILTLSNSGPFEYAIDGGAYTTFTPSGTNVVVPVAVTGLASTNHVVTMRPTTTTKVYLLGVGVRNATGLLVTNHGCSGSATADWLFSQFYNNGPVAVSRPADAVLLSLGTNDARDGVTAATFKTNLQTLIGQQVSAGRAVGLVVPSPGQVTQIPDSTWAEFVSAYYDLADTNGLPLVDFTDQDGSWDIANAAGKRYDSLHETAMGYRADAATALNLFL